MKLIDFRSFDNYFEANTMSSLLESEGLHCFLKNENITLMYGAAFSKIILQLPEEELELAEQILKNSEKERIAEQETIGFWESDVDQLDPSNKICPFCGSKNTRRVEDRKDSFILSWLFDRLKMDYQSNQWHCFHCGKLFKI